MRASRGHRRGRHRLRILLQSLRQQRAGVRNCVNRGARTLRQMIDEACAGITDPAEVFSLWLGLSVLLGRAHPEVARFITGAGLDLLEALRGLAPRALRDVEAGQHAGQFTVPVAEVALSVIAGGLIRLLRPRPERSQTSRRDGGRPARRSVPPPTWPSRTQGQTPRRAAASGCRVLVTVIP